MRLFAELDTAPYEEIQDLISKGKYDSVEQFLRVAAQNQLAIERSDNDQEHEETHTKTGSDGQHWRYTPPTDIPTGPPFGESRDEILLFSQYYRFFPLKCALYHLGKLTVDAGGAISLKRARQYISEGVWPIRKEMAEWEERNDIKKQNRKSTGLPKDQDQSMKRYLDHYVGKVRTQKREPAGFGHDMGYVSFIYDEFEDEWSVQLTLTGARFIQIENPLLTYGTEAPTLGEEEQAFVVTTIKSELDEEYRFMNFVYDTLEKGEGSYSNHLDQFRSFLEESPATGSGLSDNSVRSTTAGAISRMVELGILERGRRRGWYNPKRHPKDYESVSVEV